MKKLLLNLTMLLVALLWGGNVQIEAYTTTLSETFTVNGYKTSAFYNFLDDSTPLPTTGDLRYRDANYGLFNFGSGNRSATINIALAKDQLVVVDWRDTQNRSITVNSISHCTETTDYKGDNLKYFIANEACTSIDLSIGRGGCILSILVLDKDNSVATAGYAINYKYNGEIVSTKTGSTVVGNAVEAELPLYADSVKYFAADSAKTSFEVTATEADNVFDVALRKANDYAYIVLSSFGDTIAAGSSIEGESVKVGYPHYILQDGTLYSKGATNKEYNVSFTPDADNYTYTLDGYAKSTSDVVYYSEAEDIEGLTVNTYGNVAARASKALAALAAENTKITTLPAGKYILHAGVFSSATSPNYTIKIKVGETTLEAPVATVNASEVALTEVELKEETDVTLLAEGMGQNCLLDYIYIVKTGVVTAINGVAETAGAADDAIYTINGMKVEKAEKGIYIINGKKYIK